MRHLIRSIAVSALFVSSAAFAAPQMTVDLTLPENYRRPNITDPMWPWWVENTQGQPVKNLKPLGLG